MNSNPLIIRINRRDNEASFFVRVPGHGRQMRPVNILENPPYQPYNKTNFREELLVLKNIGITSIPDSIDFFFGYKRYI